MPFRFTGERSAELQRPVLLVPPHQEHGRFPRRPQQPQDPAQEAGATEQGIRFWPQPPNVSHDGGGAERPPATCASSAPHPARPRHHDVTGLAQRPHRRSERAEREHAEPLDTLAPQ